MNDYVASGDVRIVYRHLVQLGEGSMRSAEASECAGAQGRFWAMHNALYAQQERLFNGGAENIETYTAIAGELGLDGAQFQTCMEQQTFVPQIERDFAAAQAEGVRSRPVFDINGTRLIGAQPYPQFQQLLDQALGR